ncbi:MAG: CoA transferase [Acidimicrobiia bacterium]
MRGQWAPVQETMDLLHDPMVEANGYLQELHTKDGHAFHLVTTPVQFDEEPQPSASAPEFNEHGDDILTGELGLDWDTVIDLKVRGIVADREPRRQGRRRHRRRGGTRPRHRAQACRAGRASHSPTCRPSVSPTARCFTAEGVDGDRGHV